MKSFIPAAILFFWGSAVFASWFSPPPVVELFAVSKNAYSANKNFYNQDCQNKAEQLKNRLHQYQLNELGLSEPLFEITAQIAGKSQLGAKPSGNQGYVCRVKTVLTSDHSYRLEWTARMFNKLEKSEAPGICSGAAAELNLQSDIFITRTEVSWALFSGHYCMVRGLQLKNTGH